jgi:ABC-type branched-subunit amino acid transport system ATPase component
VSTSPAEQARPGALRATGVTAGYGGAPVIHDVDLAVDREQIVAVIGPNGAGKSTLVKAIAGTITPSAGLVQLAGRRLSGLRADEIARQGVGYVPQTKDVFVTLTVRENLEMGAYTVGKGDRGSRLDEVSTIFPQLGEMLDRRAGNLSGGERKMLAIGRVLMTRPSVLILDEPTANLSPKLAAQLLEDHIAALARTGVAILLVEQRALEALAISNWAYVMVAGRVALSDEARAVRERGDIGELFLGRVTTIPDMVRDELI